MNLPLGKLIRNLRSLDERLERGSRLAWRWLRCRLRLSGRLRRGSYSKGKP